MEIANKHNGPTEVQLLHSFGTPSQQSVAFSQMARSFSGGRNTFHAFRVYIAPLLLYKMDRISSPSKNEESFLPLDRLVEVYLRSDQSKYDVKDICLQIMGDIKYVSISCVISENLIVLNRSGNHLLTSLVYTVLYLSNSMTTVPFDSMGTWKNLHLGIRLYIYLALLPIEQIQCNKSLWNTWIEIGHTLIKFIVSQVLQNVNPSKGSFTDLSFILPFAV